MSVLCMTGWQQKHDALSGIAPDAVHCDYGAHDNVEAMFTALPRDVSLAVGWSLGGQLLVRAVAGGYIAPRALLLLGAPFQHVADAHFAHGLPAPMMKEFRRSYMRHPKEVITQFHLRTAQGDAHSERIAGILNEDIVIWQNGLLWLDELADVTCRTLDFSRFPKTFIVHGAEDKIIYPFNAQAFADSIPASEFLLWKACGHAPHLHDPVALSELIAAHV